jgi:heterodisulfide reductase subunit B
MMETKPQPNPQPAETLAGAFERETGQNVSLCYQCARCSSGCPVADKMDLAPHQVMRALQLDDRSVLAAASAWLCASCYTCTACCPQSLDVAGIMDAVRIASKRLGVPAGVADVDRFSSHFLANVRLFGRVYELGLMAGMNLASGRPFANVGMGMGMLKRGKLNLLPAIARAPRQVEPVSRDAATVAYYPGCSLHSTAREYDRSIRHVAGELGLKLVEPPGWTCCGASAAHTSDHALATELPLRNLRTVERMGLDTLMAPCSSCYSRTKAAAATEGASAVRVATIVETLIERVGVEAIARRVRRPLDGLKVACYYGCLMTRPPDIVHCENPEYPTAMEDVLKALGAEPVDWSYKTDCCGATLGMTKTGIALEMTRKILVNARACGAELIVAVCPMCHVNLDARQSQIGLGFAIPVLYLSQLMAWAFASGEDEAGLRCNFVDPTQVLHRDP